MNVSEAIAGMDTMSKNVKDDHSLSVAIDWWRRRESNPCHP